MPVWVCFGAFPPPTHMITHTDNTVTTGGGRRGEGGAKLNKIEIEKDYRDLSATERLRRLARE